MPRQADPELEQRILDAACKLWNRGGEKALTMRAVAKAASTTTPTVYERYRDREEILHALRLQIRAELFAAVSRTQTLRQACQRQLQFALQHSHAYQVLFDGVGQPPSLHEPWPTFNLMRQRVTELVSGTARDNTRLMLAIWSLMHGTCMLIIRGRFEGALRSQTLSACLDAIDSIVEDAARCSRKTGKNKWQTKLILGEGPPREAARPARRNSKPSRSANHSRRRP